MKKLTSILIFVICPFLSFGQTYPCAGVFNDSSQVPEGAVGCNRNSSVYNNFYRHLESYIPTSATVEKIIHVNLIIWQEDDGTTNWQDTPEHRARLNQIINWTNNQWFDKNAGPTDPIIPVTDEIPNLDKRFHS